MPEPPKAAERLLRWLVGGRDADAVSGDLRESYAARGGGSAWYWAQALSCIAVRLSPHRRMLPGWGKDFRYALRTIRRSPGYAVTAMLCLALAMGVNTTLFSFLDSLYFRKLPVPQADRLVRVGLADKTFNCTWKEFQSLRPGLRSMDATAALTASTYVDVDRANLSMVFELVSANFAQVLRLSAFRGRWFVPEEDQPGAAPAAVISHSLWQSKLHSDPAIIGKQVMISEMPYHIVGVGPPGFRGVLPPLGVDVWVPAASIPAPGIRMNLIGRLKPGATLQSAAAEMRVLNAALRAANPGDPRFGADTGVEPASGILATQWRKTMGRVLTLLGAVCGMVLLIACVNVANLLLSRAAVRKREMAIRQALGAGRARLFRQTIAEGLVLSAGGVILGIFAGIWTGRLIESALPSIPIGTGLMVSLQIDWRVGLFLAASALASAILFSLPPAIESCRHDPNPSLKGSGTGRRNSRQREFYSLAQVALSLTLLIATGLLLRAFDRARSVDLGFATADRLSTIVFASPTAFQPKESELMFTRLLEQVRAVPGIQDTTLASGPIGPASGGCASAAAGAPPRPVAWNIVEPNYFDMMRLPIVKGAGLGRPESVVVSETMARSWWPGEEAIGQTLWVGCGKSKPVAAQVTGVARDTQSANNGPQPAFYISRRQNPGNGSFALIAKTAGNPYHWTRPVLEAVQAASPRLRIYETQSMEDAIGLTIWEIKWQTTLLASLGLLAIVLAAIGLYGVVACSVSQRTQEIGLRVAIGAAPGDVQWMVLGHGLRITVLGVAGGLVLSFATVRLLRSYLFGLSPFDPVAFVSASLGWLVVAMLASWFPARRATRIDPLTALKYE